MVITVSESFIFGCFLSVLYVLGLYCCRTVARELVVWCIVYSCIVYLSEREAGTYVVEVF
jgi:hypothetical protein